MNKKKLVTILLFVILILCLSYSIYKVVIWHRDNLETSKIVDEINNNIEVQEVDDSDNTEVLSNGEDESLYYEYINMKLINVDFSELKSKNKDTVGWIQLNGTNVNYPFVQGNDNEYYLVHSFDRKPNSGGWVFLDYRNNIKSLDKNTIIYAHGRENGTMFGTLKNILKSSWVNDKNNYVLKMSTESENTLWQVFSVYRIPTISDYLKISFYDDNEFLEFVNMLKNRSQFDFKTNLSKDDKILTLSTCYNLSDKVVLHAKLIKREAR